LSFDPRTDDLFLTLAEERLRLQDREDLHEGERKRQAKQLKLTVNAACFGLPCQVNVSRAGRRTRVEVVDLDGNTKTVRIDDVVEEPGRWYFPPLAAGVTAAGRLILRLIRLLVERAGGRVCYWDTDSVCVTGLTHDQLCAVQDQLERLSRYSPELRAAPDEPLLLALEPENLDPETGKRRQLYLDATASKSYQLYALTDHQPPELVPVKVSEHGLGHLRPPDTAEASSSGWIEEGKSYLLRAALGLPAEQPPWWDEPALSIITLNRPDELHRLEKTRQTRKQRNEIRPFCRLAVAHPARPYARTEDGSRRTPVAPFHAGFNPATAAWRDLTTGQPLRIRLAHGELTETDLRAEPGRVLTESIGTAIERDRRRCEAKALGPDGGSCGADTIGKLQPAPTEALRAVLIGKETRNIDRAGVTEDPTHTIYSDVDDDAWQQAFLPTIRALAPQLLGRGRPSRTRRAELAQKAGELAKEQLHKLKPDHSAPDDPEQACHLYLKTARRSRSRTCECGCGQTTTGRALYVNSAHRTRAYRSRRKLRQEPSVR
jgi:hypothetical protein